MAIFSSFQTGDVIDGNPTTITTGLWTGDTGSLEGSTAFLNDDQVGVSGEYYVDVYNTNPATDDLAEVQFAITYGHINGGGAPTLVNEETSKLPTTSIYSQYRNLLLDEDDTKFKFKGVESDHIYVINIQRSRLREQLDPGNWQLPLSGANGALTFIDDSFQTLGAQAAGSKAGRIFNVVSGSITSESGSVTASANSDRFGTSGPGYGLVYPDLGFIVLNPDAICKAVGFFISGSTLETTGASLTGSAYVSGSSQEVKPIYTSTNVVNIDASTTAKPYAPLTSSVADSLWGGADSAYNHAGLYTSLRTAIIDPGGDIDFRARSAEEISSRHYFVRLRNTEFNYSNNPTFTNANGTLVVDEFKRDPKVYITTVGLYNNNNELLAVAKLSKPLRKSFNEEILLRVRLDF